MFNKVLNTWESYYNSFIYNSNNNNNAKIQQDDDYNDSSSDDSTSTTKPLNKYIVLENDHMTDEQNDDYTLISITPSNYEYQIERDDDRSSSDDDIT